ncbi:MAG: leucine-rich repeat domain-containing protein [Muribaculaceae bacterium]|nr:leucine-rich repeat domain-containing protein [Muribaculaceae bacterium]
MKTTIITGMILFAAFPGAALEISLTTGSLPGEMEKLSTTKDETVVLRGAATGADLTLLHSLSAEVKTLDLSALSVKGVEMKDGNWFGATGFKDGELPAYMLIGSGIRTLKLPSGLTKIGRGAFNNCASLTKVEFGQSTLAEIPPYAFAGCSRLEEINLPSRIDKVGEHAFENTAVKRISLVNASEIGAYAFAYAESLERIDYSSSCRMGEGAFFGAGALERIVGMAANHPELFSFGAGSEELLKVNASTVGEGAYKGAPAVAIAVGESVKRIEDFAFASMPNLSEVQVTLCSDIPEATVNSFAGIDTSKVTLYVNKGDSTRWKGAPVWNGFRISEDVSIAEAVEVDCTDISIGRSGSAIVVRSATPLTEVSLFSADGKMLSRAAGGTEETSLLFPDGEDMIIVRATADGKVRIAKLIK